jgi:gluconokinase
MIVILMGVSGSGKTTVGRLLARDLGWPFYDADDFHPPANVEKMHRGVPLTDADRAPWLDALHALIERLAGAGHSAVLACSALKQSYRDDLRAGVPGMRFVYLHGDGALIAQRLAERRGHFMPADLLRSQLGTLEEPTDAITVDVADAPERIAAAIRRQLAL